ncbi:MAG: DsrE family protein [Candidatus Lokiarchaeota archaeon]|jgi:sulfur relay protein TusD/DsrE
MVSFTLVVCTEPYKFEAMATLLNLGQSILEKGHQIMGIFFYGSGVYNINKDINISKSMKNIPKDLELFVEENNLKISACSTWINFTGLKQDSFIKGACQVGLGGLSDWMAKSDRVIVFGPGD